MLSELCDLTPHSNPPTQTDFEVGQSGSGGMIEETHAEPSELPDLYLVTLFLAKCIGLLEPHSWIHKWI